MNKGICCHMKQGRCGVLIDGGNCGVCSFHQTERALAESKAKAAARLRSLPESDQEYYANKYHSGKMPWKEATSV